MSKAKTSTAAGAATSAPPADPAPRASGLRVVARAGSFRRAGREFGPEPVDVPLSDLTDEQIEALENEPNLVTTRIDIEPPQQDPQE